MPAYIADLHNHTPLIASDYRGAAETTADQIVSQAAELGIDVYAVTDHYSFANVPAVMEAADRLEARTGQRVLVVPGVELRITHGADEVHLAALFDPASYATAATSLFDLLGLDRANVPLESLPRFTIERDPAEVCRAVHALGGICTIAHADRDFGGYRLAGTDLFERLLEEDSVVAVDLLEPQGAVSYMGYGQVGVIGCSDSHSLDEMGNRHTMVAMPELSFSGLRRALERRATVPVVSV